MIAGYRVWLRVSVKLSVILYVDNDGVGSKYLLMYTDTHMRTGTRFEKIPNVSRRRVN